MDSARFRYKKRYTKIYLDDLEFDTSTEFRTLEVVFGDDACSVYWPLETTERVLNQKKGGKVKNKDKKKKKKNKNKGRR